jgi:arylsulfatase A-like enzyme
MRLNLSILLFLSFFFVSCQEKVQEKPNVLFILTDDQGWGDMSSHGNEILETPVLDQLAADGAEFDRFFVSPLCAPTRASLLTGRYHLKTGATSVSKGLEIMDADEETIAEVFKENGYAIGIFGKWHNGSHYPNRPTEQGFDEFIGFCAGHWTNYFNTTLDSGYTEIQTKGFITDYLTDKAIDFIDRKKDGPFFCYVPFNAPHSPFQVPDKYFDKYKAKGLDDELASIYGMVENVDDNIARLLKKLDDDGLAENTIVVFMTDNGPNGVRYNGHMKGVKGHVDEGGVRVPSIIKWPGKIAVGKKIKQMGAHIDWLPTLTELCGIKHTSKKGIDGISLANSILNEEPEITKDRTIFSHVAHLELELKDKPGTLRTEQYRFVLKGEKPELYDMINDPNQENDIAESKIEKVNDFNNLYQSWFKDASKNYQPIKPVSLNTDFVELPAYESQFSGQLKFIEGHGWAHDYLVNWTSNEDEITWLVNSDTEKEMTVFMRYTCPENELGSKIAVSLDNNNVTNSVTKAFDPPLIESPDRIRRKENYEKDWALMEIGKLKINKGQSELKLSTLNVSKNEVADFKSLILRDI